MKNIASYYGIDSQKLQRHYKYKVSGYGEWGQLSHAGDYLIYPENITARLSIDEVSLSRGELYTFVTNKNINCRNKKCLVAVINGTEAKVIQSVLDRIPLEKRNKVTEVTMDMARNMALAVERCFLNCKRVIDRFHAVKLVLDAVQHLRVKFRWEAIDKENKAVREAKATGGKYEPEELYNGDTEKELLARSRYLFYALEGDWTVNQTRRATILFERYPLLQEAYRLSICFRGMYSSATREIAEGRFMQWKDMVKTSAIEEFNSVVHSIEHHLEPILNFFNNRSTNANAESFNSKIKGFRANLRGVTDVEFFLYRLEKLFA
jgi:transposase